MAWRRTTTKPQTGGPAGLGGPAEFSADTADLSHFVDRGRVYMARLEELVDRVDRQRSVVVATIGSGLGPADLVSSTLGELIAEAELDNAMVEVVGEALAAYGGTGGPVVGLVEAVEGRLAGAGLAGLATEVPLADDLARLRGFRLRRLEAAGLSSEAAAPLVDDPGVTAAALLLLGRGVHPDILAAADPDGLERLASAVDSGLVDGVEPLEALLTGRYAPSLEAEILAGRLPAPDDRLREQVVEAMLAGHGPGDGIDAAYFPVGYLRHRQLSGQIAGLEARREDADGSSWSPWDGSRSALAEIDRRLDRLVGLRADIGARLHIADDGAIDHLDAVAAVAGTTGGSRWEGATYGRAFNRYHETQTSHGLAGGEALREPEGYGDQLRHLAARVWADPAVAVAFYNRLGARRTGDLATLAIGNGLDREAVRRLGKGLAAASRQTTPDGRPRLAFGGDDLLTLDRPATERGVVGHSPALLFDGGRFDDDFLADATVTVLRLAHEGDRRGFTSYFSQGPPGDVGDQQGRHDGGQDPRNLLLAQAAERPAVARAVVERLVGSGGPGGRGRPAPESLAPRLAPLLAPSVELALPEENRTGWPTGPGAAGGLEWRSASPLTAFLGAVAVDDEASRLTLLAAAGAIDEGGPIIQNEATAAGLDLILAGHATSMFEPGQLSAVGIGPTDPDVGAPIAVGSDDWRAVHGEVLRLGRGQALAVATDSLVSRAIVGATGGDGKLDEAKVRPFAHLAGRIQADTHEATFAYAAGLDEAARRRNRVVSTVVGGAIGLAGFVPMLGPASWAGGGTWTWFFQGEPTDAELESRRASWLEEYYLDAPDRWGTEAVRASLLALTDVGGEGRIELAVPGRGLPTVPIRRRGATVADGFEWQDPRSGHWSLVPEPDDDLFDQRFPRYEGTLLRQVESVGASIGEDVHDGVVTAAAHSPRSQDLPRSAGDDISDAVADAGWTDRWVAGP